MIKIAINIQDELLIEDIAIILRIEFWLIPKIELIINKEIIINNKVLFIFKYEIKIIGLIFCQVNIIRQIVHESPSIIEGSHKWNGIILNLINNGIIIIMFIFNKKKNDLYVNIIKRIIDENAWIKKYFIVASNE